MLAFEQPFYQSGYATGGQTTTVVATLDNTGTVPAPLDSWSTSGDFEIVSTTCPASLAAGGSCTFSITFTPTAWGETDEPLVVVSGSTSATTTLAGTGFTTLTVVKSGTGNGDVHSVPSGIDCGTTCSETIQSSTLLSAVADGMSVFDHWEGACTGTSHSCSVSPGLLEETATAVFTAATSGGLTIDLVGPGHFDLRVENTADGSLVGTCAGAAGTCFIDVAPGTNVHLASSTTAAYAGLHHDCSDTFTQACTLTIATNGSHVELDSGADPRFQWDDVGVGDVTAAVFDSTGHLILAQPDDIENLTVDVAGHQITYYGFGLGVGASAVAAGPNGVSYAISADGQSLIALGGSPWGILWTAPLDATLAGCTAAYTHCVAANAAGAIAVRGPNGLGVFDDTGALQWEQPLSSSLASVAIAADSTVYALVVDGAMPQLDVQQYSAGGIPLVTSNGLCLDSQGDLYLDAQGQLVCTSTNLYGAQVTRMPFGGSIATTTDTASETYTAIAPTFAASAPDGSLAWFVAASAPPPMAGYAWFINQYAASGSYETVLYGNRIGSGIAPSAMATDGDGNLYIFARYWHVPLPSGSEDGALEIFGPSL